MLGMGRLVNCRLLPSYVAWLCNQGLANSNKYLISPRPELVSVTKPHASHHQPDSMEPIWSKIEKPLFIEKSIDIQWVMSALCELSLCYVC